MTQVGISVMCECATFPFCLFAVLNNRIVLFSSPFSVLSFLNPWFIDCVKEKSKLLTENKKEHIHKVDSQYRLAPCFESTLLSWRYFSWTIQPRRNEIQERWQRVHICDINRNRYACVKKKTEALIQLLYSSDSEKVQPLKCTLSKKLALWRTILPADFVLSWPDIPRQQFTDIYTLNTVPDHCGAL